MKFEVAKTRRQQGDLHTFFESCAILHDPDSGRPIFLFRPGRLLAITLMLVTFFPTALVVTLVLWAQMLAPEAGLTFADMVNPWRWAPLLDVGRDRPVDHSPLPGNAPPLARPLLPKRPPIASRPAAPALRADSVYTVRNNVSAAPLPYGPVLTDYFAHYGGAVKLETIQTVQVEGNVVTADGSKLTFTMLKRPPDKIRLSMRKEGSDNEATLVTNGTHGWRWVGDPLTNGVAPMTLPQLMTLEREALFCNVAVELYNNHRTVREISRVRSDNEPYHRVLGTLLHDMRLEVMINEETERAERIQIQYDEGGSPMLYSILVRDWMQINEMDEPLHSDVYVSGQKVLTVTITRIDYNGGLLNVLFEPPAGAPIKLAAESAAPATSAPTEPAPGPAAGEVK